MGCLITPSLYGIIRLTLQTSLRSFSTSLIIIGSLRLLAVGGSTMKRSLFTYRGTGGGAAGGIAGSFAASGFVTGSVCLVSGSLDRSINEELLWLAE